MRKKVIIIGGDKRFIYLKKMLSEEFDVLPFCEKEALSSSYKSIESADIVLLPYPITFDGESVNAPLYGGTLLLRDVFSHLRPYHTLLTGGKLPAEFQAEMICNTYDYTANEELLWANAKLTAEGLLRLVIEELPTALTATRVAVIGYGRVGRAAAELLCRAGCNVTAFARRPPDAGDAHVSVLPLKDFAAYGHSFDCVVNSVPALVLDDAKLASLREECVLLEAASTPYGIDFKSADKHGLKSIIAGSLPGKTSPKTAAEIICKSVMKLI